MRGAAYAAVVGGLLGLGLLLGLASSGGAEAASVGSFSFTGTVTRVVDGDTVDVTLSSGKRERVRLVGIDTPERGSCYFSQAGNRARFLALNNSVTLRGDATQDTRDRYGRLLAYVDIAGGTDLGATLIREGYGQVYVYSRPFARLTAYRTGQSSAKAGRRGLWSACNSAVVPVAPAPAPPTAPVIPTTTATRPPTTAASPPTTTTTLTTTTATPPTQSTPVASPPPASGCHPNYSNCLPIVSDLNCPDVRAMGKAPVQVIGADPYRLDADNDGLGCE